jgi:hypothetical protein
MERPTPEKIKEAREVLLAGDAVAYDDDVCIGREDIDAIRILLAATMPPTDEEVAAFCVAYKDEHLGHFDTNAANELTNMRFSMSLASGMRAVIRAFLGTPEPK